MELTEDESFLLKVWLIMKRKKVSRKSVLKGENPVSSGSTFRMSTRYYFLTFKGTKQDGTLLTKEAIRRALHEDHPSVVKPQAYFIAEELYDSGEPHFHCLLRFEKRKEIRNQRYFDVGGVHPNIQALRNLPAALDYLTKEDSRPLTNLDLAVQVLHARASNTKLLYDLMLDAMKADPMGWDVAEWLREHDLSRSVYKADFSKAIRMVKMVQPAYARDLLREWKGIHEITRSLITQRLSPEELRMYDSDPCFARIVAHVNEIRSYPNLCRESTAPAKTRHLLIVGDPDIGKSALLDHRATAEYPHPGLSHYYSTFNMSTGEHYFPPYESFVYPLVRWDEFVIDSRMFPKREYNRLLEYLGGGECLLSIKYATPVRRSDNPKHILTSNRPLSSHIDATFKSEENRLLARSNLGVRVESVHVRRPKTLHFLRKLFVSSSERDTWTFA